MIRAIQVMEWKDDFSFLPFLAWDQSDKFVKVFLTGLGDLSKVSQDQIVQQFTRHSVSIRVNQVGDRNLLFNIYRTGQAIDPEHSYVKVKSGEFSELNGFDEDCILTLLLFHKFM